MKKNYNVKKRGNAMKIDALEYFVALAEFRSVNKAAKALYVAQPSLSKALANFEKELGIQLFYRDNKGLKLTEAGEKILPEAKQVLTYYRGWKELATEEGLGEIEIYTQSVFAHFFLPDILLGFKKMYPGIKIKLNPVLRPGEFISHDFNRPAICLAVCNDVLKDHFAEKQGNPPVKLMEGEYRCLLNGKSPLAFQKNVAMEELKEYYFTMAHFKGMREEDGFLYPLFREIFDTIPGSHTMEAESLANVVSLIAKNPEVFTITYSPMICLVDEILQNRLVTVPLRDRELEGTLYLFYSKQAYQRHQALRRLVREIREAAASVQAATAERIKRI